MPASLGPNYLRVVRNEALKVIGRRQPAMPLALTLYEDVPASAAKPQTDCQLEEEESRQHIQAAVRKLPAEQSEVVVLKIWEGFTFAEIADLVGESSNTVASRYRYALEKLTRQLQTFSDAPTLTGEASNGSSKRAQG